MTYTNFTVTTPVARPLPDLLTQAEAARLLGVGRNLIRRWIAAGTLPSIADPETGRPILSRIAIEAWQRRTGELAAERGAAS